jgi:hypothetical protein
MRFPSISRAEKDPLEARFGALDCVLIQQRCCTPHMCMRGTDPFPDTVTRLYSCQLSRRSVVSVIRVSSQSTKSFLAHTSLCRVVSGQVLQLHAALLGGGDIVPGLVALPLLKPPGRLPPDPAPTPAKPICKLRWRATSLPRAKRYAHASTSSPSSSSVSLSSSPYMYASHLVYRRELVVSSATAAVCISATPTGLPSGGTACANTWSSGSAGRQKQQAIYQAVLYYLI